MAAPLLEVENLTVEFRVDRGWVTAVAATVMIAFHLNIIASIPMGVPLEWNVFMILGVLVLFVEHAEHGVGDLSGVGVLVLLVPLASATFVVLGNLYPERISFLPGMRYYAGNWDTTVWCFTPSGLDKFDAGTLKAAMLPHQQLEKIYGVEEAEVPLFTGYAFRAMHTHGRAHFALIPRACGDRHDDDYLEELAAHHVGGHLKVAPEHVAPGVLELMKKQLILMTMRLVLLF